MIRFLLVLIAIELLIGALLGCDTHVHLTAPVARDTITTTVHDTVRVGPPHGPHHPRPR